LADGKKSRRKFSATRDVIRTYEVKAMERILMVGCDKAMNKVCVGCSRCLVAFNRCDGEFTRYSGQEAELMGLASCGGCPGYQLVPRLANMKLWNAPLEIEPTKIHLAPCVVHCPHFESIIDIMEEKCGIEIIRGTHPYQMQSIFGPALIKQGDSQAGPGNHA
jgi:predicted metal-binding protein